MCSDLCELSEGVPGSWSCNEGLEGSWFGVWGQVSTSTPASPSNLEVRTHYVALVPAFGGLCLCVVCLCTCRLHSMHACFAHPVSCSCIPRWSAYYPSCAWPVDVHTVLSQIALHLHYTACTQNLYLGSWHAGDSGVIGCAFGPLPYSLWWFAFGPTCQAI